MAVATATAVAAMATEAAVEVMATMSRHGSHCYSISGGNRLQSCAMGITCQLGLDLVRSWLGPSSSVQIRLRDIIIYHCPRLQTGAEQTLKPTVKIV